MSVATTDADYNAIDREVQVKLEIYFQASSPLIITRENYLISSTLLEEAHSDTESTIGTVSSNELTFDLHNDNGIFTPTNTLSPYYGLIRRNVKVIAFGRVGGNDKTWDALGTYYVKEWVTTASGMTASVTANDRLYDVFDAPQQTYYVTKNESYKDFYYRYFRALGVSATIDASLVDIIPYTFIDEDNKEFLSNLSNGALALCYGNRQDGVTVLSRLADSSLRSTITDEDQIMTIDVKQSVDIGYDGASVTCNAMQEGAFDEILSIKEQAVAPGLTQLSNLALSKSPLVRFGYIRVSGASNVKALQPIATPDKVSFGLQSSDAATASVDISVYGTVLETVSSVDADNGSNLLSIDSKYVQTPGRTTTVKNYLERIVESKVPILKVSTRGNFKFKIGDKIKVESERFKTDYTGIIIRNEYNYNGGLSCTLTLVDSALFGGGD